MANHRLLFLLGYNLQTPIDFGRETQRRAHLHRALGLHLFLHYPFCPHAEALFKGRRISPHQCGQDKISLPDFCLILVNEPVNVPLLYIQNSM
jgi:hypothetical protein